MNLRARRATIAAGAAAVVLLAGAAALVWWPGAAPKQIEPQGEQAAGEAAAAEPAPEPRPDVALAAAQAHTLALSEEVARLRWLALSERRACIQPPPEPPAPTVAEALEPRIEGPDRPPEPAPPVIVAAVTPPPPPPPSFEPQRDPPPPPPEPPAPPPQVAVTTPQPQPPSPPPPAADPEFDSRIQREGGQQSDQLVTLIWNNINDLDLHVVCPNGVRVYFANIAGCGSQLDIDMNATTNALSRAPVENIVWPRGLPPGRYQVFVDHYANHGAPDPTPFRVRVRLFGEERVFNGTIRHGEPPRFITDFTIN